MAASLRVATFYGLPGNLRRRAELLYREDPPKLIDDSEENTFVVPLAGANFARIALTGTEDSTKKYFCGNVFTLTTRN